MDSHPSSQPVCVEEVEWFHVTETHHKVEQVHTYVQKLYTYACMYVYVKVHDHSVIVALYNRNVAVILLLCNNHLKFSKNMSLYSFITLCKRT